MYSTEGKSSEAGMTNQPKQFSVMLDDGVPVIACDQIDLRHS